MKRNNKGFSRIRALLSPAHLLSLLLCAALLYPGSIWASETPTDPTVAESIRVDRYATSLAIARYAHRSDLLGYTQTAVATGEDFPDALASSVMQGRAESVLLLTPRNRIHAQALELLAGPEFGACESITFIGGHGAISDVVRAEFAIHAMR